MIVPSNKSEFQIFKFSKFRYDLAEEPVIWFCTYHTTIIVVEKKPTNEMPRVHPIGKDDTEEGTAEGPKRPEKIREGNKGFASNKC